MRRLFFCPFGGMFSRRPWPPIAVSLARSLSAGGRSPARNLFDPYIFCSHLSGLNFAQMHLRIRNRVLTLSAWCLFVFRHGALGLRRKYLCFTHTPKAYVRRDYVSRLHIHNYILHSSYSQVYNRASKPSGSWHIGVVSPPPSHARSLMLGWIDTPPPRVLLFAHSRFSWCTRPTIR